MPQQEGNRKEMGTYTAGALVVSAMIGTGVYTSLGFQLQALPAMGPVLLLWIMGGTAAFCGAMTYGRIGSLIAGSGGEYLYLSQLYHPALGFISGFVSATVGFAAPVALSSLAFGNYLAGIGVGLSAMQAALALLAVSLFVNLAGIAASARWQRFFTLFNLCLIASFVAYGLYSGTQEVPMAGHEGLFADIFSAPFAISLVYVSYAYSGWNTAAYIAGEVHHAKTTLTKAFAGGSLIVMLLYVLLNYVFMKNVPIGMLAGKIEVAHLAAEAMFGTGGAVAVSALICAGLCASVNSMMMAGPHVAYTMGKDYTGLAILGQKNKKGAAYVSLSLLSMVALLLIITSAFQAILTYIGFTVSLFATLTALGLVIRYFKYGRVVCSPAFLLFPLVFILIESWMMVYLVMDKTTESLAGMFTLLIGYICYRSVKSK